MDQESIREALGLRLERDDCFRFGLPNPDLRSHIGAESGKHLATMGDAVRDDYGAVVWTSCQMVGSWPVG